MHQLALTLYSFGVARFKMGLKTRVINLSKKLEIVNAKAMVLANSTLRTAITDNQLKENEYAY